MEDQKTAAQRQAIEAEGIKSAKEAIEGKPKVAEVKRSRFDRRLENRKKVILDKLVLKYFTQRSTTNDPEGVEAACLFDSCEMEWRWECKTFNRGRQPFKLRYEAFSESVEFYLKMEKTQIGKTQEENKMKAFDPWFRRKHVWRTAPFKAVYYWLISLGNAEKQITLWKNYYKSLEIVKKLWP